MNDTIELWEAEIEQEDRNKRMIEEARICNFYGDVESLNESIGSRLKSLFKRAKNTKRKDKKEITKAINSHVTTKKLTDEEKDARGKLYDNVIKIFKKVYQSHSKEDSNFSKGFTIGSWDEDGSPKEDFINGSKYILLGIYDAWGYTDNQARTPEKYEEFSNAIISFQDDLSVELKEFGRVEAPDDWDDGGFYLYPTDSAIKKYME